VDQVADSSGHTQTTKPKLVRKDVVSSQVSQEMQSLMEGVVQTKVQQGFNSMRFPDNYSVGGKTGTAQIADPAGGYYADRFNGTFIGFVGGDKPQYVIAVYNTEPHVIGYAGSHGGQPVFADLAHMLINNSFVNPKTR